MKAAIMIFLIFLTFNFVASDNNDDSCKWIYRCCKKVDGNCVEICEPEIICDQETTTQQEEEETTVLPDESATFQAPSKFSIIAVDCRKGFRVTAGGKCRKII